MTSNQFKECPLGRQITEELEKIKIKHDLRYDSINILSAIFFSYISINSFNDWWLKENDKVSPLKKETEKELKNYVMDYDDILKHFLVNFMDIDESKYIRWSASKYNSTNTLALSQPCRLLAPTYAWNKDQIH